MLNVLPPAFWEDGMFLVGEPVDGCPTTGRHRFAAYRQRGVAGVYDYEVADRPLTLAEARAWVGRRYTPMG